MVNHKGGGAVTVLLLILPIPRDTHLSELRCIDKRVSIDGEPCEGVHINNGTGTLSSVKKRFFMTSLVFYLSQTWMISCDANNLTTFVAVPRSKQNQNFSFVRSFL